MTGFVPVPPPPCRRRLRSFVSEDMLTFDVLFTGGGKAAGTKTGGAA